MKQHLLLIPGILSIILGMLAFAAGARGQSIGVNGTAKPFEDELAKKVEKER